MKCHVLGDTNVAKEWLFTYSSMLLHCKGIKKRTNERRAQRARENENKAVAT